MSKRLKITTIISDEETGKVLIKQESIINVEEPINYFGLKNVGHDFSYLEHLKKYKYGTVNEPTCNGRDCYDSAIQDKSEVDLNEEVTANQAIPVSTIQAKSANHTRLDLMSEVEKDEEALAAYCKEYIDK